MIDMPRPAEPGQLLPPERRRWAIMNALFKDGAIIRTAFANIRRVDEHLTRAAQPLPMHLRWAARNGFRTVLNLRGRRLDCGSYFLEHDAAAELGLKLVDFPIRSRSALEKGTILAAIDLWEGLEYPVFMHCKSGADRTGFMATLYQHIHKGIPLREAMDQLSLRYGHVRQAKTGVIDFFYERYLSEAAPRGLSLREWVEKEYDRATLDKSFKENWVAGLIVNKILRRE